MQEQAETAGHVPSYPPEKVQVGFYHLTRIPVEEALPPLLERTLAGGQRALIRCRDKEQVTALDAALWAARGAVWLPHGSKKMGHAPRQPIWLTETDECPNNATFLFRLNGAWEGALDGFERIFDLFDGHDEEAVQQARQRWKTMRQAGYHMTYWKQEARGWAKAG